MQHWQVKSYHSHKLYVAEQFVYFDILAASKICFRILSFDEAATLLK